jgi:E3 ubiquitin-protein ligase HUWE1
MSHEDLQRDMYIFFAGEPALDMGGVTREFYRLLSEEILDANNALFLKSGSVFHPNPSSVVNEEHLQYFKFIGKLVGKCLYDMNLMETHFSRVIFKLMIGKPIDFEDLEYTDPSMYLAMRSILQSDQVDEMYLSFSAELNDLGSNNQFPLVHNGESIAVTDENKVEFVNLYSRWKLVESVRPQLTLFLAGYVYRYSV